MRMLVIGGCHIYGYGLRPGQSFIEQFGRRLEGTGQSVAVDYYTPFDLPFAHGLVRQLNLDHYDLIVLQLGNYRLQHPPSFKTLLKSSVHSTTSKPGSKPGQSWKASPATIATLRRQSQEPYSTPSTTWSVLKTGLKLLLLSTLASTQTVARLNDVREQLASLLHYLKPHRQKVVLLTPFPHLDPVSRWMRQRGRTIFRQIGKQKGVPVLDTHLYVRAQKQYFITDDAAHLNAIGHELLGLQLYDFYCAHLREPLFETVF